MTEQKTRVRTRVTPAPPPVSNTPETIQDSAPEKSLEYENALVEISNLYPAGTEGIECRIYKKLDGNKNAFVLKLDYFPDESEVKEKCGSGEFKLFCAVFEDGKRKFLKAPVVNIIDTNPAPSINTQLQQTEPPAGVNTLLDQLKAFKEAGLIPSNNSESSNMVAMFNMMNEQNKANQTMLLELMKLQAKPEKSQNDKILEVLLSKALDKSDPMKEINTILKIKDSLAADVAPAGDDGLLGTLAKSFPYILQMMAANNGSNTGPAAVPAPGPARVPNPEQKRIAAATQKEKLRLELKEVVKEAIDEYNSESDAPQDIINDANNDNFNNSDNSDLPEFPGDDENNSTGNMELLNNDNSNNFNNFDIPNMSIPDIMAAIKVAPEPEKIKTLQYWINNVPIETVKKFIMENKVVEQESEFWEYVRKCGREDLIPEQFKNNGTTIS
jgi:hypothetical protein